MATTVGQIGLDLVVNQRSFNKQMTGITSLAKKTGVALAAALSVKKLVEFGKACIDLGSDLQEVQNVVDVTFPSMTAQMDKFASSAATNFGLSETMAKRFSGTYGSMAKAFGFTEKQAYDMGTTLTGLAGDVASFYNITQDEAYTKLKSVFTGETESLKDLGVVMTQTALDSYALANGFGKTTSAMSEAEKVALRYSFVQNQLSAAQGDFARTSGGWANQVRILNLQIDSLKANIGQGLINLLTPVLKVINALLSKLTALASAFKSFTELITGNKASESNLSGLKSDAEQITSGLDSATNAAGNLGSTTAAVGNAAKKAAKEMKSLMGFDEINKLSEKTEEDSSGTTAGGAGLSIPATTVDYGTLAEDTGNSFFEKLQEKFGKLDFTRLTASLQKLKDELKEFGAHLGDGLKWLLDNVLIPLAGWVITEVAPRFFETLANVLAILNPIIEALKPLWQWFWENILKPLAEWTGGIILKVWDAFNGALERFAKWCEKNPGTIRTIATIIASFFAAWKILKFVGLAGEFKKALGMITGAFSPVTLAIEAVIAIGVLLWQNWDTIKEKATQLKEWVVEKAQGLKDGVSEAFSNLKKKASESFTKLKTNAQDSFKNLKTNVSNTAKNMRSSLKNEIDLIKQRWSQRWTNIKTDTTEKVNGLKKSVSEKATSIQKKMSNVGKNIKNTWIDNFKSLKDKVTSIMENLWSGLKRIINSILGGVEKMANGVIKGINKAISALNNLSFDVPSWVPGIGGNSFGFDIPSLSEVSIPRLAEGGFVKANTPRLAMIGDNRHQGEIVAPENKMQNMADDAAFKTIAALENYITAMMAGFEAVVEAIKEKDTDIVIGDEHIGKANERYEEKRAVMTGGT